MDTHPFICLNMIVKNESKTIPRLLESVINQIDVIVISDTGSTDNTKEVVNNIVKLHNKTVYWLEDIEFKNFGYNRTFSLKGCVDILNKQELNYEQTYILLMDADMIFKQTGKQTLKEYLYNNPEPDSFNILQGSQYYFYYNNRIISKSIWHDCYYVGPTHEYISMPDTAIKSNILKTDFFIEDIGDGGSKQNKFERDIILLKQGLIDEPNNERYMFYLANSMRDAGHQEDAIEMYKKRIDAGGWFEEVWYSYYEIGNCYKQMNNPEQAIIYWLKAFNYSDYRIENLYEIVYFYCRNMQHKLAYHFYFMAQSILNMRPQKEDILFFKKDIYDYLLDFEFTILANYYNPFNIDIMSYYMKLFK